MIPYDPQRQRMETKFTPGPWVPQDYRVFKLRPDGLYDKHVAWTAGNVRTRTPQALADALLIAAAPDMYAALDAVLSVAPGEDEAALLAEDMVRAALAKARGDSPS